MIKTSETTNVSLRPATRKSSSSASEIGVNKLSESTAKTHNGSADKQFVTLRVKQIKDTPSGPLVLTPKKVKGRKLPRFSSSTQVKSLCVEIFLNMARADIKRWKRDYKKLKKHAVWVARILSSIDSALG